MAGNGESAGRAILIAGPTASGKSRLALDKAAQTGGVIVNTDSMQVYSVLNLLTARPQADELAQAPHRLYGHVDPGQRYSTGAWLRDVKTILAKPDLSQKTLIFVGGTGLYFKALLGGLSEMPDVPSHIRRRWRYELAEKGPAKLHRLLRSRDPNAAMAIKPGDGQRIVRALEVLEASGMTISDWREKKGTPLVDPERTERILLIPDREILRENIRRRFEDMVKRGALDEVRALVARNLDRDLPAMKAIGVRELSDVIENKRDLKDAVDDAITATRQYAKRQMTWFRHQFGPDWMRIETGGGTGKS